ncbi:PIG-L family deacetylase [Candidatus Bathyarchaeota archaeon]|nr:PIG-L family deacetylase [Candidatus Bathyarchaeota archaeon]MBS7613072.1 PIG-L family deacetylase [Candidatus Bathyarchaeota archaeon]
MSDDFTYYDLLRGVKSNDIGLIFNGWHGEDERVVILSPHDDDALLGAGYLILAVMKAGGEPYIVVYCDGRGGYSSVDLKDRIVSIRRYESLNAYRRLGVKEENIVHLDYPDFSLRSYIGWVLPNGLEGLTFKTIKLLRRIKPTRLLVPNEYREHMDHEALSYIGSYDGPQIGDPVMVDLGPPFKVKSYLKYCVWGDFSPEDAFLTSRSLSLRGNVAVKVKKGVEEEVIRALEEFKSQKEIIKNILERRKDRLLDEHYIEVYQKFNPRPEINYQPYRKKIAEIDKWLKD